MSADQWGDTQKAGLLGRQPTASRMHKRIGTVFGTVPSALATPSKVYTRLLNDLTTISESDTQLLLCC